MERIFHSSNHDEDLPDLLDLFDLGNRKGYAQNRNPKLELSGDWTSGSILYSTCEDRQNGSVC